MPEIFAAINHVVSRSPVRRPPVDLHYRIVKRLVLKALGAFVLIATNHCLLERCMAAAQLPIVARYGLFQIDFRCPDMTGDPFDPTVNDVWATLTGPRGQIKIPAYWSGDGIWSARLCPEVVGSYHVTVARNGVDETSNAITSTSFLCVVSASPGFVRTAGPLAKWPHFSFDNGSTYFPLGMDAAWTGTGEMDYPDLFQHMALSHMNFARVWMTFWDGKALDWAPERSGSPVPGTFLLSAAKRLDAVFDAATASNIYVQLTLQHHGQVTRVVDPNWDDNPLNADNPNGFLKDPDDFFTDSRAIALTKSKYRYIVARYGWNTHLLGWELFNEIQNNPDLKESDYVPWHNTMIAYIRSIDPYHHMITTSYTDSSEQLAKQTSLDYYQPHAYPNDPGEYFRDQAPTLSSSKPLFWGEFGASGDQTLEALHNGLWAGLMDPCAGAPEFWYWTNVQSDGWWDEFASAAAFVDQSGLSSVRNSAYIPAAVSTLSKGPLHLAPGLGWAAEKGNGIVTVSAAGLADGMAGVPSFIQGKYHHDMMPRPLTIDTDLPSAATMHVKISVVSASGAHLQVSIDGQPPVADLDMPGTGADRSVAIDQAVTIPSGPHSTSITNTGLDHFTLGEIVIDDAAPGVMAMVRQVDGEYVFWVNRTEGAGTGTLTADVSIQVPTTDTYRVVYFNTSSGCTPGSPILIKARMGRLTLPITMTENDIAGWIRPAT